MTAPWWLSLPFAAEALRLGVTEARQRAAHLARVVGGHCYDAGNAAMERLDDLSAKLAPCGCNADEESLCRCNHGPERSGCAPCSCHARAGR